MRRRRVRVASCRCCCSSGLPELIPVMIAPGFVEREQVAQAGPRPKLAGALEAALLLPARALHRSAPDGPAASRRFFRRAISPSTTDSRPCRSWWRRGSTQADSPGAHLATVVVEPRQGLLVAERPQEISPARSAGWAVGKCFRPGTSRSISARPGRGLGTTTGGDSAFFFMGRHSCSEVCFCRSRNRHTQD